MICGYWERSAIRDSNRHWKMIVLSLFLSVLPVILAQNFQLPPAKISAFNIQIFGENKYSDVSTRNYLVQILSKFDITLIQEIRDVDGESIFYLLEDLNKATGKLFEMVISERLGRTNSKEQYAYFYDSQKFLLESTHQYPVSLDKFERPPFGAVFTSNITAIQRFGLIGIHTKPSDAPGEIARLQDVYDTFVNEMKSKDIMIMGDFNGGCSYTTKTDWESIAIRKDPRFDWLLGDDVDTTVSNSDCAYDRFAVGGSAMRAAIVPNSAATVRFDKELSLSTEQALEISDHYPIEVEMFGKLSPYIRLNTKLSSAVILEGPVDVSSVDEVKELVTDDLGCVVQKIRNGWRYALVSFTKEGVTDVVGELKAFQKVYPKLMRDELITMMKTYVDDLKTLDDLALYPGNVQSPDVTFNLRLEYWKQGLKIIVSRNVKTAQ